MLDVGRMMLTRENWGTRRKLRYSHKKKNFPRRRCVRHKSHMHWSGFEHIIRRDRPATNCLSCTLRCDFHHVEYSGPATYDPFSIFKSDRIPRDGTHKITLLQSRCSRDWVKFVLFLCGRLKPSVKNPTKIPVNNKVSSFSPEGRCERLCVYLFVVGR